MTLEERGAAMCGAWFTREEMSVLADETTHLLQDESLQTIVVDTTTGTTRTIYGAHRLRLPFAAIASDARLTRAAEAVLGEPAYLYQSKLNPKLPGSAGWDWHIDFQAWSRDDGMPEPKAVTFGVFIDDVTDDDGGPFVAVAGSHRHFGSRSLVEAKPIGRGLGMSAWQRDFGVTLKYPPPRNFVADMLNDCPRDTFTSAAGGVMAFLGATLHGSARNVSDARRALVYFTYNAESNRPNVNDMKRPTFIAER